MKRGCDKELSELEEPYMGAVKGPPGCKVLNNKWKENYGIVDTYNGSMR